MLNDFERKEEFFGRLAEDIKKETGVELNHKTLYKNIHIKLKKRSEATVNYNTKYLNGLSQYALNGTYNSFYPVGNDEIYIHQNKKSDQEAIWNDERFRYPFLRGIFESPVAKEPHPIIREEELPRQSLRLDRLVGIFEQAIRDNQKQVSGAIVKLGIEESEVDQFILAVPAFLLQYLSRRSGDLNNHQVFDYLKERGNKVSFRNKEGIFTAHTLSAFSDSLALFCSLGNMKRIAEVFGIPKSEVMLAHPDWTRLNKGIRYFNSSEDDLKHCLRYRKRLYQSLGISLLVCKPGELQGKYITDQEAQNLNEVCREYYNICKLLFESEDLLDRHLSPKERGRAIRLLESNNNLPPSSPLRVFLKQRIIREDLGRHIKIIEAVIEHIGYISEDTFKYFLLQRYFQHYYSGYVKTGNSRELDFDAPFRDLNIMDQANYESLKSYVLDGIYFQDYHFDEQANSVHAYSFPSGKLYKYVSERLPKGEAVSEAEKRAILVKDGEDDLFKVRRLVYDMSDGMLANIMSDLLSFAQHFIINTENKRLFVQLQRLISLIDEGFHISWLQAFRSSSTFNERVFSKWFGLQNIPYHYYPYLIFLAYDLNGEVSGSSKEKLAALPDKAQFKDIYIQIIMLILYEVRDYMMNDGISSEWGEFPGGE